MLYTYRYEYYIELVKVTRAYPSTGILEERMYGISGIYG